MSLESPAGVLRSNSGAANGARHVRGAGAVGYPPAFTPSGIERWLNTKESRKAVCKAIDKQPLPDLDAALPVLQGSPPECDAAKAARAAGAEPGQGAPPGASPGVGGLADIAMGGGYHDEAGGKRKRRAGASGDGGGGGGDGGGSSSAGGSEPGGSAHASGRCSGSGRQPAVEIAFLRARRIAAWLLANWMEGHLDSDDLLHRHAGHLHATPTRVRMAVRAASLFDTHAL